MARSRSPRKRPGFFNAAHYSALIQGIFQDGLNAVGNAGQVAILEEVFERSFTALVKIGSLQKRPGKGINKATMGLTISTEKYDAVDEILDEIAGKIALAWDDSYAGDNIGAKMYLKLDPGAFIDTPPTATASTYGYRARMISGRI